MAAVEDGITLGELARRFDDLASEIRLMPQSYVAIRVWEVERSALTREREAMGREIGELKSAVKSAAETKVLEHDKLNGRIDALKDELTKKEDQARRERARTWVAIGLAALGLVFTIIGGVTVAQLNAVIAGG